MITGLVGSLRINNRIKKLNSKENCKIHFWSKLINCNSFKMCEGYLNLSIGLFCLVFLASQTIAVPSTFLGKGIYETYSAKQSLLTSSSKEKDKFFLGNGGNSRAPAHDTPASPCKCCKLAFFTIHLQ